ncbi:MAG: hypothetical protein SFW66_01155 [Gammaproteobacteria bacterium]|nr:hypothetical protein [Gammaproteobacteria bacterium]
MCHFHDKTKHDMNNILCAIVLNTDLLQQTLLDKNDPCNQYQLIMSQLQTLQYDIERMKNIVTSLCQIESA